MPGIEGLPSVQIIRDHSNSFVVEFKDHCVLIDAGMDKRSRGIIETIEGIRKMPKAILITHAHLDHINGLARIKDEYADLTVASSEDDKYGVEGKSMLLPKGFMGSLFKFLSVFMKYKGVRVDEILKEGKDYESFKIIETPGHTRGSLSFLLNLDGKNILFCGDLVVNDNDKISFAPKAYNLDKNQIMESLRKVSKIKIDYLLSGHGEPMNKDVNEKIRGFVSQYS